MSALGNVTDSGSGNGPQDPVLRERDQEPSRKQSVQRLPADTAGDRGPAQRIRQTVHEYKRAAQLPDPAEGSEVTAPGQQGAAARDSGTNTTCSD